MLCMYTHEYVGLFTLISNKPHFLYFCLIINPCRKKVKKMAHFCALTSKHYIHKRLKPCGHVHYNAPRFDATRVFLILALVNRPASSITISSCTVGALSFPERGTESTCATCSIELLNVLLLLLISWFGVVFKTAGAGAAFESTEGPATSVASSSCSVDDVLRTRGRLFVIIC